MRGTDQQQHELFSYGSLEERIPADHPLRPIRAMADEALQQLSGRFNEIYGEDGRRSIPPERLLRALLLQMLYTVRSERMLVCLESRRLLTGEGPVMVIAREPCSRLPVLLGNRWC